MRVTTTTMAMIAVLAMSACGGGSGADTGSSAPPTAPQAAAVASVSVTLSATSLLPSATSTATAVVKDVRGVVLTGRTIAWTSSASSVATVDGAGGVTAVGAGSATITATCEGQSGAATLTVSPPVASVSVSVASPSLLPGASTTARATLTDASGATLTGRSVQWASLTPNVATIDAAGVVSAVTPGTAVISATSEGKTGSTAVTVLAPVATVTVVLSTAVVLPGASVSTTVEAKDVNGTVLQGRAVTYASSAPTVASVSTAGVVTAIAPGTAVISAIAEGKLGTASLTVLAPVAVVGVTIGNATLAPGARTLATVSMRDAAGAAITGRPVQWSSSAPAVATVDSIGGVTAFAPGVATITASVEGKTGSATLSVTLPPITSVVLTGSQRTKAGDAYGFFATARLADGTIVSRPIAWSVRDAASAIITSSGVLTPMRAGVITVQATIDGVVWEGTSTAYDWATLSSSGTNFITLYADLTITNKFGRSEYPQLVVFCDRGTGDMGLWVSTTNFVTQNGLVAYSFDGAPAVSQFWTESRDFSTLFKIASNLVIKSFAQQIAGSRLFGFAFTEFQSSAKATVFRTTGMTPVLMPLIAGCPSNAIVAGTRDVDALREQLFVEPPSAVLTALRAQRSTSLSSEFRAPSLTGIASVRQADTQDARKRP